MFQLLSCPERDRATQKGCGDFVVMVMATRLGFSYCAPLLEFEFIVIHVVSTVTYVCVIMTQIDMRQVLFLLL